MRADAAQRELATLLRNTAIKWGRAGTLRPVVMYPPFRSAVADVPGGRSAAVVVKAHDVPLLTPSKHHRFALSNTQWPELGLHSSRYLCMGCIVEGEIDFFAGVTKKMAATDPSLAGSAGKYTVALPAQDIFLVPPGVPYADGSRPHWDRPGLEDARSRILWMQILPMGVVLHTCTTTGERHQHTSAVLVQNTQLAFLAQLLLKQACELPRTIDLLNATLLTILLTVEQGLLYGTVLRPDPAGDSFSPLTEPGEAPVMLPNDSDAAILERALDYIGSRLSDPLTPSQIAAHAYVSLPKLKRLFRDELQTPIMRYVTRRRIEEAKVLLESTTLATQEISRICGYVHRTQFSRHFSEIAGISPSAYRRRCKTSTSRRPRTPRSSGKLPGTAASKRKPAAIKG